MSERRAPYKTSRGNANYNRGVAQERALIRKLEGMGYTCVRSAGSHTPFDVVAWDGRHIRLIQVKRGELSPNEISSALAGMLEAGAMPAIAQVELWQWVIRERRGRWWRHWLQDGISKVSEVA